MQSEAYEKLESWRRQLSALQKKLIQQTWQDFIKTGKWALLRPSYREHGKPSVVRELAALSGLVYEEEDHQSGNRLRLLLPGVLVTNEGPSYQELLERYFRFQHDLFKNESELRQIESAEIATKLKLNDQEIKVLGYLLQFGSGLGGWGNDMKSWTVRTMQEAEDFSPDGTLASDVEAWIEKSYRPADPVFIEERRQKQLTSPSFPGFTWPANTTLPKEPPRPVDGNPFQRRYQVFVSSTYNDLIEERKHVMQALLETRCIPAGMELFPAASTEQMKLIQSVIDDCDYYLVIVAGKYGSCGTNGLSYTEMEFDYAVNTGKPILGFFHSDIKKLTGEKLEENDGARRKLAAFTEKIKHQRLCRSWNTADGLASAIKTAIIHAIETNPKPGWVRADSVPTWNMVQNLEQRIAELEERPGSESTENFPTGQDKIKIPAKINWEEAEKPGSRYGVYHAFDKEFLLSWDELLLHVAPEPGISTSRLGLLRGFGHSLAKQAESEINRMAKNKVLRIGGTVEGEFFDEILQTFLARKLLKQVPPPKRVRTRMPYWQLSPKGVQKLAELKAIRSNGTPHIGSQSTLDRR
jgi:hypothetical protein